MPLKLFATKDEIPDAQREGAIELKDGQFAISEDADTSNVTDALNAERAKREAAERLAKKAADELKKIQDKAKASTHGLTEDQLKEIRAEAAKDAEERAANAEKELADERHRNRQNDIGNQFKALAGDFKFQSNKLNDLLRLHGDDFDLTDDRKLMVKGKPGVDPKKHMESIAKERAEWVEGTKASGGGAAGITGTPAVTGTGADDVLKNPGAALAAARAAGKTE